MQCRSVAGRNRVPAEIWQLSPWNLLLILTRILRFSLQPQEPSPLCSLRPWFSEPLGLEILDLVVIFPHSLAYRFSTRKTPETLIPPQVKSKPRLPTGHRLPAGKLWACGAVENRGGALQAVSGRWVSCDVSCRSTALWCFQDRLWLSASQPGVWSPASPELGREDRGRGHTHGRRDPSILAPGLRRT